MKLLRIGSNLTVVTSTGDVMTTSACTDELFSAVYELVQKDDVQGVKKLLVPELVGEEKKFAQKKQMVETIHTMVAGYSYLFEKKDTVLYRIGIPISIPEDLAMAYVSAYNEYINSMEDVVRPFEDTDEFKSIDNFWMWCALNPNPQSRDDLFRFLREHGMPITKQGMFLAYRRVVSRSKSADAKLLEFVSNTFVKIRSMWKADPIAYYVCEDNNNNYFVTPIDSFTHGNRVGNLAELYSELAYLGSVQFTDNHTRTMDYRIGVEARISRHEGNQSNQVSCSRGLHVASKAYDYSGFGDTPIMVVVNPMDVLAVPQGEDGKLRTCAFTPVAVLQEGEESVLHENKDFDSSEILVNHVEKQLENLRAMVNSASIYELNVNHILGVADRTIFSSILSNISGAEQIVNSRVENLYEEEEDNCNDDCEYDDDGDCQQHGWYGC
jgi:hypothetical protein